MKVYELAKQLGISNLEMVEKVKKLGIEVKSHLSALNDEVVEKVKGSIMKKDEMKNQDIKLDDIKKEDCKKADQMHIIRRNVKVINTDGNTSEVEEITTNVAGDIKKSHQTIVDKKNDELGVVSHKQNHDRRPKIATRPNNIVITRNGKPVVEEAIVKEEKVLIAPISETIPNAPAALNGVKENEKNNIVDKKETSNIHQTATSRPQNSNYPNNNSRPHSDRPYNNGYNQENNRNPQRPSTPNQTGYNNRPHSDRPYNNNNGYNRPYNNTNNTQSTNVNNRPYNNNPQATQSTNGYNRPYNNTNTNTNRPYNNTNRPYNNTNTTRPYNNTNRPYNSATNNRPYNNNSGFKPNGDNTSYQVNKFIKQAATQPIEQKEVREHVNTSIDKKKYNTEKVTIDPNKAKLDKNKLREQHSRVSTTKLKGLEVDTSSGMLDLYERESDKFKKSNRRKPQRPRVILKQNKIIPMTEVKLPEIMTVKEFAEALKKQASEIIKKLFSLGIMATVNQEIDFDTAFLIAAEFGITAQKEVVVSEEEILFDESEDEEKDLEVRPPIVVVMGHVDHGKTSLLDRLRSAHVATDEAGGITQHIGAYKVQINGREICFLDTPGHEAFTAMRARGAQVTDIAIIVVAADDGIKPQTIEAIDHAKAAGVSIIVAINKIDKVEANIEKVKQELLEHGLVAEEWGGDTICVPISAKSGEGIDSLLEMVLLVADMKDLKANPNKQAKGTVIEARLDKTKGTIVSALIQRGTLNVGDTIVVGDIIGKVRAMKDDKGKKVKSAGPSTPVELLGLSVVPQTGDLFYEVENEKVAKQLVSKKKADSRRDLIKQGAKVTLSDLFSQIQDGKLKDLNVIIKADVQGSVEALKDSLSKLSNEEVRVRILHASTGGVKESDVTLASVSNAIIIGFNVRPESLAQAQAKKEKVDLRLYRVIYDAIDDVQTALKGMLTPKYKEIMLGCAEVRKVFKVTGVGMIAGCYITDGKIVRNTMVRLVRDSIVIFEIKIDSLKREKEDVKEVAQGYECGIKLEKCNDIKEGDLLECFELQEEKRV
ncbi:MAG: translation initiation factor IF-2 [Clostridia bacterium]